MTAEQIRSNDRRPRRGWGARMVMLLGMAAALLNSGTALAQQPTTGGLEMVNVRFIAEPNFSEFSVDGVVYVGAASFNWREGTRHVVSVAPLSTRIITGGRYKFAGWSDDKDKLASLVSSDQLEWIYTASKDISEIRMKFTLEWSLKLRLEPCPAEPHMEPRPIGNNLPPILVRLNGTWYDCSQDLWFSDQTVVTVGAQPRPGLVFLGWTPGQHLPISPVGQMTIIGPSVLHPMFANAKRLLLKTEPAELHVKVDRTATPDGHTLDVVPGNPYRIGDGTPTATIYGVWYMLDSWTGLRSGQSGKDGENWVADNATNVFETVVARFRRAVTVSLQSNVPGLSLRANGRDLPAPHSFHAGEGQTIEISAPGEQRTSDGTVYVFRGWGHGGAATQQVKLAENAADQGSPVFTATYEALPQLTLRSSPSGLGLLVNGAPCTTPCRVSQEPGTEVTVEAPATVAVGENTRQEYVGWSDGGSSTRTFRVGASGVVPTAQYRIAHRLAARVEPEEAGTVTLTPASADGFYPENTPVEASVERQKGYTFRFWTGDTSTLDPVVSVTLSRPMTLIARMQRGDELTSATVRNAAGETPVAGVAPHSMIRVLGDNFTSQPLTGPTNPATQMLGGVSVRVADRVLPLLAVAPTFVEALLPSDLAEGTYQAMVAAGRQTTSSENFRVVRNAPGLFTELRNDQVVAAAEHEDRSLVSPVRPARRGAVVTLFGTGFGPAERSVFVGFPAPTAPANGSKDAVEVLVNDAPVEPLSVTVAPGRLGQWQVRLRIGDAFPRGALATVRVRVNGVVSNDVALPVE